MPALVDTNVLVYRFDPRFPEKQRIAHDLLRNGIASGDVVLAHQTIGEFMAAVTRPLDDDRSLLDWPDATREAEEMLLQFDVVYPSQQIIRLALRGRATYQLSWVDAHMWAYAEHHGLQRLLSEDFQHGRTYGAVTIVNPFA
ncbi:MAG: PIN domain-containing protein [Solirubrobacteraceae bacterium]